MMFCKSQIQVSKAKQALTQLFLGSQKGTSFYHFQMKAFSLITYRDTELPSDFTARSDAHIHRHRLYLTYLQIGWCLHVSCILKSLQHQQKESKVLQDMINQLKQLTEIGQINHSLKMSFSSLWWATTSVVDTYWLGVYV